VALTTAENHFPRDPSRKLAHRLTELQNSCQPLSATGGNKNIACVHRDQCRGQLDPVRTDSQDLASDVVIPHLNLEFSSGAQELGETPRPSLHIEGISMFVVQIQTVLSRHAGFNLREFGPWVVLHIHKAYPRVQQSDYYHVKRY
jgi:hypothetical protein